MKKGFLGIIVVVLVAILIVGVAVTIFYISSNIRKSTGATKIAQVSPEPLANSVSNPIPLSSASPSPDTLNVTNWQTYTDPTYKFSVKYPPTFKATVYPKTEFTAYNVSFSEGGSQGNKITVEVADPSTNSYPQILSMVPGQKKEVIVQTLWFERNQDIGIEAGSAKFYNFEVIIPDTMVKLGPSTAKYLDSKLDPGQKISNRGKSFILVKNGMVYSIGISLGISDDPQLEQQFIGMATTLKFTQ